MNRIARTEELVPDSHSLRFLRRMLLSRMAGLRHGRLLIIDALGETTLGDGGAAGDIAVRVEVHDLRFYKAIASHGSVGAGESYMDGQWQCDDLVGLIRLLVRNRDRLDGMESGVARVG